MRSKRVWLTGAKGLLGTAIQEVARKHYPELEILPTTRETLNYSSEEEIADFVAKNQPDIVVNCIAFTNVDAAESQYSEALLANTSIPLALANALGTIPLIHISTDHIFGGDRTPRKEPYREEDIPMPANRYALTKLIGEYAVHYHKQNAYILRTSWLYGPAKWPHKSFYKSILSNAQAGKPLRVVTDEVSTPTSVFTLAEVILEIASEKQGQLPFGIYHVADVGPASRHTFASKIVELLPPDTLVTVGKCTQADWALPAFRPHFSALSTEKITHFYPTLIRPWQERLQEIYNYDIQGTTDEIQ